MAVVLQLVNSCKRWAELHLPSGLEFGLIAWKPDVNCTPLMGISHASEQNKEAALKRTLYDPAAKTLWRPPFSGLSRPGCIVLEIREHLNQLLQQDGDFHSHSSALQLVCLTGCPMQLTTPPPEPHSQNPTTTKTASRLGVPME